MQQADLRQDDGVQAGPPGVLPPQITPVAAYYIEGMKTRRKANERATMILRII